MEQELSQQNAANKLQVEYVDASLLKASEYNPRKWDAKAEAGLRESMEKFGLVDPIIVNGAPNRKNIVIGGHFRLHMAKKLGISQMPVVYVDLPDVEKEKELNLRLNRNTGEWDFEILKSFDMEMLMDVGFDDADLSDIWNDSLEVDDDEFNVEKELEAIKNPITKTGDIYQLGRHVLVCGDSTDSAVIEKLTDQKEVSMIYCDPPYNISLSYNNGIGTSGKYGGTHTNDNKSLEQYREFLKKTIENALSVAKSDYHIFYWCDQNYIGLLQDLYREIGITNRRVCLWIKNNSNLTPQIAFNKAYESCVYGSVGSPYLSEQKNLNEILNKEVGTGNGALDDILDVIDVWVAKRLAGQDYTHPTEKPITLHEKPLRRCTKIGDTVLDLMGGSGSTLISCEQMKRRCLTVEWEPIFCDLIVKRFEALTGEKAKLLNSQIV
jgi:DNA modification methylase